MGKMLSLTKEQLISFDPCNLPQRLELFGSKKRLTVLEALDLGVSIPDLLWVASRLGRKDLCVRYALLCAQRVAHLNSDPRVQSALDATQRWLDNPTADAADASRSAAHASRSAAYAAGDAAYAADAARSAAYAARSAAYAAGDAAYAAGAAADTAGAVAAGAADASRSAADDAHVEEQAQREIFVEVFVNSTK